MLNKENCVIQKKKKHIHNNNNNQQERKHKKNLMSSANNTVFFLRYNFLFSLFSANFTAYRPYYLMDYVLFVSNNQTLEKKKGMNNFILSHNMLNRLIAVLSYKLQQGPALLLHITFQDTSRKQKVWHNSEPYFNMKYVLYKQTQHTLSFYMCVCVCVCQIY